MSELTEVLTGMENHKSVFEQKVRKLPIPVANAFLDGDNIVAAGFQSSSETLPDSKDKTAVSKEFQKSVSAHSNQILEGIKSKVDVENKRVAVLFSGGPASGGHNVIAGIFKALGTKNTLLGVKAGPKGLLAGDLFEITEEGIAQIVNTGGFDFLGSDRTKIKTDEQFQKVKRVCEANHIDAIIVIGGDDSNTNAAVLAEYLYDDGVQVIGVPKTIDGDLQVGDLIPISFGFDTATKTYAELVGNILQDTPSSRKYWHFIKLMGRSASHVALEVALQTKPAICLISEEVQEKAMSMDTIINNIVKIILQRAASGVNHGVVLVPEGLVEFVPEMKVLIEELNDTIAKYHEDLISLDIGKKKDFVYKKISAVSAKLMASLPDEFEAMLLLDRDSHGNLQVSQIPTEKLLIEMVKERIAELQHHPEELDSLQLSERELERVKTYKYATNNHFFGYEGRCGAPTLFDAAYTFNLGLVAGSLILSNKTGYIAGLSRLNSSVTPMAIPLTALINIERRHGQDEFVIEKALTRLDSPAFMYFESRRDKWAQEDLFTSPGPRQLWGPASEQLPMMIALDRKYSGFGFKFGKAVSI